MPWSSRSISRSESRSPVRSNYSSHHGIVSIGLGLLFAIPVLQPVILPLFWFGAKSLRFFIFIWIRGTLPRFRYDQLMDFAWKFMFLVALVNLLVTAFAVALGLDK
ncbi:MAG: NADH-quinone oxidoreductase subunit H [Bryobacteraceae bacterium]